MTNTLAWSVAVFLIFTGCRAIGPPPDRLRVQFSTEPVSLDPALAEDGVSLRILANVMDGLVGYDGAGVLRNRLAESYSVSPDGRRYVFTLRRDAHWSDGREVTAEDFVTGIRRALGPRTRSKLAGLLFAIRGAEAYHRGARPPGGLGVTADHGKLVIALQEPTPYFLQALTLGVALPAREDILAAHGDSWPELAPSTGPYRVVSHVPEQSWVLERNPAYPTNPGAPARIDILIVPEEATGLALFQKRAIDILTRVPFFEVRRLRSTEAFRTGPYAATNFLAFNTRKAPFNLRDWRCAVSGAVHRDQIVAALDSGERVAASWVPPELEGAGRFADPALSFRGEVYRVRGALKPATPLPAGFDSSSRSTLIMEKVQQDVLQGLGLQLSLQNLDWKSYIKGLQVEPPAIYRFGWQAPFFDPISHLMAFLGDDPNNYTGWKNARYDQLVHRIARLAPGGERAARIQEAQQILLEKDCVVIPLYHYVQNHLVSPRVSGFRVNVFGEIRFDELRLVEEGGG